MRRPLIALALCALMLTGCERLFPSAYEGVKLCERWEEALDLDGDTYPSCVNPTWPWKVAQARPADCDDTDPNIHPGATEVCEASRDVDEDWAQVGIPVLLLHGVKDWEVDVAHATALQSVMSGGGNGSVTIKTYPSLGHRMSQPVGALNLGREYYLPFPWDSTVELDILAWSLAILD